jgi:hypothetical protein
VLSEEDSGRVVNGVCNPVQDVGDDNRVDEGGDSFSIQVVELTFGGRNELFRF